MTNSIPKTPILQKNRGSVLGQKSFLQKIGLPHHEYWPWWILVAPVWPLWLWYGIRLKCATWFTTVNPAIEDGGFMGESKIDILNIIPDDVKPKTFFVPLDAPVPGVDFFISEKNPEAYPIIAKPDIGGRGRKIKIIKSFADLEEYHHTVGEAYMLQEIVESPLELGVFYARMPDEESGRVISLSSKGFLKVIGNGVSTIAQLMAREKRAKAQIDRLGKTVDLQRVPTVDEEVILEPIGNHVLGTIFIDENHRITDKLNEVFDDISKRVGAFYYGRYDLRVTSWEDLEAGKNISILELNGLTSDAAHIFDPNYKLKDVFKTQFRHIKIAARIAKQNIKAGTKATPVVELAKKSWEALKMM